MQGFEYRGTVYKSLSVITWHINVFLGKALHRIGRAARPGRDGRVIEVDQVVAQRE